MQDEHETHAPAGSDIESSSSEHNRSDGNPAEAAETPFALVAQFFVIPLVVVALAVFIFFIFGLLGGRSSTPEELLGEVRTGSLNRRWQAAFQLSTDLSKHPELSKDPRLLAATLDALDKSTEADVRRYLVLALGRFESPAAVPVLIEALGDNDEETKLYAALALGSLESSTAVAPLTTMLGAEQASLRKAAAYALGHTGDTSAVPALRVTADDRSFPVALQAALALAQLGDGYGAPVLHRALTRAHIDNLSGEDAMTPQQREESMINAIRGVLLLRDQESRTILEELSRGDDSLKVRDAARRAIESLSSGP